MKIIDLTCPLDLDYALPVFLDKIGGYEYKLLNSVKGAGYRMAQFTIQTHYATHIDAPMHVFERDEKQGIFAIEDWPLEQLYGEAVVLDIPKGELEEITADDLEKARPEVRAGDIVLIHTGWGRFYVEDRKSSTYLTCSRPGVVTSAAEWLVKKKVKALGTDTVVTPHPKHKLGGGTPEEMAKGSIRSYEPVHRTLLGNNIVLIEQLTNLDKIKGRRVTCGFFPLRVLGLDGCPCRALAFLD